MLYHNIVGIPCQVLFIDGLDGARNALVPSDGLVLDQHSALVPRLFGSHSDCVGEDDYVSDGSGRAAGLLHRKNMCTFYSERDRPTGLGYKYHFCSERQSNDGSRLDGLV